MRVGSLLLMLALMSSCEPRPQLVQTLLSMLGLQEERVAHPRVRDVDSRARRVDAPPRQSHAFASPHFQQQQPYITQQNNYETSYNNNFQGTASRSGEPIGGEITPNCVCRCTCCPC